MRERGAINISLLTERRSRSHSLRRYASDKANIECPRNRPIIKPVFALIGQDITRQSYVTGEKQYHYPMPQHDVWGDVNIFSVFRCDGCNQLLFYKTYYADAVPMEEAENLKPEWVFDVDDPEGAGAFQSPYHLYFTERIYPPEQETSQLVESPPPSLHSSIPKHIAGIYHEALSVKDKSPNSFAALVGKALEAVQKDLGIPKKQLEELESKSAPDGLSHLAIHIRNLRNSAAHYNSPTDKVTAKQADEIDELFRLLTEYVYVLPKKLKKAQAKLKNKPQIIDGIH